MAKVVTKPRLSISIVIEIDEEEARALDALAGYGDRAFIDKFYRDLGRSYLEPYETGLRRFLTTIRSAISPALNEVDNARKLLEQSKKEPS